VDIIDCTHISCNTRCGNFCKTIAKMWNQGTMVKKKKK